MTWKLKNFTHIKRLNFIRSKCQAIRFDGLNESLQGPNDVVFDFDRFDPVTFAGWFKFNSFNSTLNPIISKYETMPTLGRGYLWGLHYDGVNAVARFNIAYGGSNSFNQYSVETFPLNDWFHYATSYTGSGSATGVQHYLNGVALTPNVTSDNLTDTIINTGIVEVGSLTTSFTRWSNMDMNRVRMWNTALTPTDILEDMANQSIPKSANLVSNLEIGNDTRFNSPNWNVIDKSETTAYFVSSNMDISNKILIKSICV